MTDNLISMFFTDAGLNAVLSAQSNGLQAHVSEIRLGDAHGVGYAPQAGQTDLVNARVRTPIVGSASKAPRQLQITSGSLRPENFIVGGKFTALEAGVYLDGGQLLAVWSHPVLQLCDVAPGEDLTFSFNLCLDRLPPGSISAVLQPPTVPDFTFEFAILATAVIGLTTANIKLNDKIRALEKAVGQRDAAYAWLAAMQLQTSATHLKTFNFKFNRGRS